MDTPNDQDAIAPTEMDDPGTERYNEPATRRSPFRALVQDFGPVWFTWCMNAGALAQLIANCPYRFSGVDILADIFFVKAVVMYTTFTLIFLTRLLWFKREAYNEIVNNIVELTFVPCWDIAWMTLTGCVSLIVSNAWWGGYPFTILAYAMWWFVQVWNISALYWAFCSIAHREILASVSRLPTSILIPGVSASTVAVTGASIANYASGLSAKLAVPVMIVSFYWAGAGALIGLVVYVYLLRDLATLGWLGPDQTATIFLLVGPMGQSAAALQLLGAAAAPPLNRFGEYNAGTFITTESAQALATACTLVALLLNGLGVIWLILGVWLVVKRARQRSLKWNPTWNAVIFPNSTLTTSMLVFSESMDSPAYRVLGCVMIVILVMAYLTNMAFCLTQIWQGRLLIVREDWRAQQRVAEEQKDK